MQCLYPGCGQDIPHDHALCDRHWFNLPARIRLEAMRFWKPSLPLATQDMGYGVVIQAGIDVLVKREAERE